MLESHGEQARAKCSWWCDVLKPTTAKVLAEYDEERYYAGTPAITENAFGSGKVIYMGTLPGEDFLQEFVGELVSECGIPRPLVCDSPMVEVILTRHEDADYAFILNFSLEPQTITLKHPYVLLSTGQRVGETLTVAPVDIALLKAINS